MNASSYLHVMANCFDSELIEIPQFFSSSHLCQRLSVEWYVIWDHFLGGELSRSIVSVIARRIKSLSDSLVAFTCAAMASFSSGETRACKYSCFSRYFLRARICASVGDTFLTYNKNHLERGGFYHFSFLRKIVSQE